MNIIECQICKRDFFAQIPQKTFKPINNDICNPCKKTEELITIELIKRDPFWAKFIPKTKKNA